MTVVAETPAARLLTSNFQSIRVPGIARDIRVKIASQPDEWAHAFELVANNYRACGYEMPSAKLLRFTPYHALPGTVVFVALHEQKVVATFSLVPDNRRLGLPMETIYGPEIDSLRLAGCRLGEGTSLAVQGLSQREFVQVYTTLIRLLMQYHVSRGGDTWVITVNPHHRNFYCKSMGFQPLGTCRTYPAVADAPAEAFVLDRKVMKTNAPKMYEQVFGEWLPPQALAASPLPAALAWHFAALSSQTDIEAIGALLSAVERDGPGRRW
jgi:hypothetical protein